MKMEKKNKKKQKNFQGQKNFSRVQTEFQAGKKTFLSENKNSLI